MNILITTGLSSHQIGGPAKYGYDLKEQFIELGHSVKIASYGLVEKVLPIGIRHVYFFLKILPDVIWADRTITLDSFSVGVASVLTTSLFRRKVIIRIGGDFLWESYVERTGDKITLKQFNTNMPELNLKEKLILYFTKTLIKFADRLAFNTEWQREIWQKTYDISRVKACVIRNYIPERQDSAMTGNYFLWAGRMIRLKNLELLKDLSKEFKIEVVSGLPHDVLQKKIRNCYAVILPSFSEVCPNFILEAISYGKPFIMTAETGLKEIYDKGGIFIDPFDNRLWRESILNMLNIDKYDQYKNELVFLEPRSWRIVAKEFLSIC